MVFLIHIELRCTVNHKSDLMKSCSHIVVSSGQHLGGSEFSDTFTDIFPSSAYFHYKTFIHEKVLRKLKWQISGVPLAAWYNRCQGPVSNRGLAFEIHWFIEALCSALWVCGRSVSPVPLSVCCHADGNPTQPSEQGCRAANAVEISRCCHIFVLWPKVYGFTDTEHLATRVSSSLYHVTLLESADR